MEKEVILITGCTSGIGRELCILLAKRDYRVVATARDINKIADVPADTKVQLDVSDDKSVKNAIKEVIRQYGKIDVLVNNAGYSVRSAVEEINLNKLSNMFEVNVYGAIRMIQEVAPYMREKKSGKIINIGSISGKLTSFVNGGYCASKHALEAISDAARLELREFGVQVSVLEPGAMDTDFFHTLSRNSDQCMSNHDSPYRRLYQNDMNYRKKQKRADARKAAEDIIKIVKKKKLKARYKIVLPKIFSILIVLPDSIREKMMIITSSL